MEEINIREKSLDWFLIKDEIEKGKLKEKYFSNEYIDHDNHWGYHFTFSQIEYMYRKEFKVES